MKTKFSITISGNKAQATEKANALVTLGNHLDVKTLKALANIVKTDPQKVQLAKNFLGV